MNIYAIFTVVSLAVYLLVGFWSMRSLKSTEDFYVMGRNASAFLICGTFIATNISSVAFVGYVGGVSSMGCVPYIAMYGGTVCAGIVLCSLVARYLWRMDLYTVPDFFTTRYTGEGSGIIRFFSTAIVLFSMIIYLISVCQGVNVVICDTFGWSKTTAQLIILGIVTIFTMAGGMKGVVVTDTIMFVIFFFSACAVAPFVVKALGGWPSGITAAAMQTPDLLTWHGNYTPFKGFWQILENNVASFMLVLGSPQLLSRVFIARSDRTFAKAMLLHAIVLPIFIFVLLFVFTFFPVINSEVAGTSSFTWAAMNLAPPFIGAFAIAGIAAAALSSASSLFQQAAAGLSRDVYERYINPNASEKTKLLVSRISVLLIAVVCFIGGTTQEITAVGLLYGFLFATAGWACWIPPLLFGIFSKKATTKACAWSMAVGFVIAMFFVFGRTLGYTPSWIAPNITGLLSSALTYVIVNRTQTATEEEVAVYYSMREPVAEGRIRE